MRDFYNERVGAEYEAELSRIKVLFENLFKNVEVDKHSISVGMNRCELRIKFRCGEMAFNVRFGEDFIKENFKAAVNLRLADVVKKELDKNLK